MLEAHTGYIVLY